MSVVDAPAVGKPVFTYERYFLGVGCCRLETEFFP